MPALDEAALVAVLLPPPEAARAAVACWEQGVGVAPLNTRAPAPELRGALDALCPTELWDGDGRRPFGRGGVPVASGVAAVVLTSGTMGEPKSAELTFSGLAASGSAVTEAVGAEAGDGWLCCLPMHHVAGLAVVGRAWATGTPVVVHPRFDVDEVGRAAAGAGPMYVSLVATMLTRLLDAGAPVERFQGILLGGGPIDPAVRERAEAAGAAVSTTYGMTETWGGIVHNGHPLRQVELRLDGHDGDGEILVRAPMVMRGYRLRPDLTGAALSADGWYRTGDVGRFDDSAGGRLRLVDRLGDMIKTGGVKVAPTEVERVLAIHPEVADVCVAARPDREWGERVVAFVVPRNAGAPPALADLRAFALEHLAAPKAPKELVLVEAIPRSAGGKPLRRLLPS